MIDSNSNLSEQQLISIYIDDYEKAVINCQEPKFMNPAETHNMDIYEIRQIRQIIYESKKSVELILKSFYWHANLNISEKKPFNLQDRMILIGQQDKNSVLSHISYDILSIIFQLKFKITLEHNEYIKKFYSTAAKKLLADLMRSEKLDMLLNQCNELCPHVSLSIKSKNEKMENGCIKMCTIF